MAVVLATISLSQGFDKLLVSRAAHTAGPELIGWVALGVACGEAVCSGCSASLYLWCCSLSSLNVSSICWEHECKSYYEQSTRSMRSISRRKGAERQLVVRFSPPKNRTVIAGASRYLVQDSLFNQFFIPLGAVSDHKILSAHRRSKDKHSSVSNEIVLVD